MKTISITLGKGNEAIRVSQEGCESIIEAICQLEEMGYDVSKITQIETETEIASEITYTGYVNVPLSVVDNLITTALEGGSNYWYFIPDRNIPTPDGFVRNSSIHYEFLDKVYQGSILPIHDDENNERLGEITNATIQRGIRLMFEVYPQLMADAIKEDYDADCADLFLQLVVMGEIVYG